MYRLIKSVVRSLLVVGLIVPSLSPAIVYAKDAQTMIVVTTQGRIDDRSLNQGAWEGIQEYGKENGLEKGNQGYDYLQSNNDSEIITNITQATHADFDLIYAVGFKLVDIIEEFAPQNPDQNYVMMDGVVEGDNVASINFKDEEAAFLAGVAAASATKTNKTGFVGGVEGHIIDRFEAGFVAGAKAVDPNIQVSVEYVGSYADPTKAKQIATVMYANDIDVIYPAAGDSTNGVFSEAKDIVQNDPDRDIWVVGVDQDREEDGLIEINGTERPLTLTSTLKASKNAVYQFSTQTNEEGFKPGEQFFGLKEEGVGLTRGHIPEDVWETIESYREQIINGELEVPAKPER